MNAGNDQLDEAEEDVAAGEELERLLKEAIRAVHGLARFVVAGFVCTAIALVLAAGSLWTIQADNERDARGGCKRDNGRSQDLVLLVEKVQDILGGPGASSEADELVEFGRTNFVQRDCDGDGQVTVADRPDAR